MKKKIVAIMLCVAMLAIAIVGGTLAYFTDVDEATNTFTVGNVKIELIESYYHREAACMENVPEGADKYDAGTKLSDEQIIAGSGEAYTKYLEESILMPGIGINKMPYVKNTGNTDAYIRIRVMIPAALDTDFVMNSVICTSATESGEFTRNPIYVEGEEFINGTVIGDYAVYEFTRVKPLEPGEMTNWNVWNTIAMDPEVTNQDLQHIIDLGIINEDNTFGVKVEADAIQADSFDNAEAAWAAFNAQTSNSVSSDPYSPEAIG